MNLRKSRDLPIGDFFEIIKYKYSDRIAAYAFIAYMCSGLISLVLNYLIPSFKWKAELVSGVINVLLFILICLSTISIFKTDKIRVWTIYVFAFTSIGLSILLHPEYSDWFHHKEYGLNLTIFPFTSGIWMLLFIGFFRDKHKLLNCLLFCAKPMFLYYIYLYYDYLRRGYWIAKDALGHEIHNTYSLDFGYDVAFCCIVFGYIFYNTKKIRYLFALIAALMLVLLGGSRGSVLAIAIVVFLIMLQSFRNTRKKTMRMLALFVLALTFLIAFSVGFVTIQREIIYFIGKTNISGRFVEMLLLGNITDDSGRSRIWAMAYSIIREKPILGAGFYGDRYVIGSSFYWGYCHNIVLELLIDYGIIVGTLIITYLTYSIVRMYIKNKDEEWAMLLIIFLGCCIKLWLSNSFWYHKFFWGLLGVLKLWRKQNLSKVRVLIRKNQVIHHG